MKKTFSNVRISGTSPVVNGNTAVTVNGEKMKGVTKIELVAEANGLWRAIIHCIPESVDVTDIDSVAVETAVLKPPQHVELPQ